MIDKVKDLVQRVLGLDIVKVFSLNAVATLVKMLASLLGIKVVSYIVGPVGLAVIGQLTNLSSILLNLANGGISGGITKYIAEDSTDQARVKKLISTAVGITLICSAVLAGVLIIGRNYLASQFLKAPEYSYVFIFFGCTIVLYALNGVLVSILNGVKEFKTYVRVNIAGSLIGLVFTLALVLIFGLAGALIQSVTFQSVVFFATLYMCRKFPWLKYLKPAIDKTLLKKYAGYACMTFVSIALLPVTQIILRSHVMETISETSAGIWEGMNRVSAAYLNVIITSFTVYYLPKLSEIKTREGLHIEIMRCYKFMIPVLLSMCAVIYFLRSWVVWLLFSPDFAAMEDLFLWQLIGDILKILSWILAYQMVAKAMTGTFIITEIAGGLLYLFLGLTFVDMFGVVGLMYAHCVNYFVYSIVMLVIFRKVVFFKADKK